MDKDDEKHPNDSWLFLGWDMPIMASSLDSELWGACGCEIHAEPHARKSSRSVDLVANPAFCGVEDSLHIIDYRMGRELTIVSAN
jgi:hypothetical protein